jgi:hypothetical protein
MLGRWEDQVRKVEGKKRDTSKRRLWGGGGRKPLIKTIVRAMPGKVRDQYNCWKKNDIRKSPCEDFSSVNS